MTWNPDQSQRHRKARSAPVRDLLAMSKVYPVVLPGAQDVLDWTRGVPLPAGRGGRGAVHRRLPGPAAGTLAGRAGVLRLHPVLFTARKP